MGRGITALIGLLLVTSVAACDSDGDTAPTTLSPPTTVPVGLDCHQGPNASIPARPQSTPDNSAGTTIIRILSEPIPEGVPGDFTAENLPPGAFNSAVATLGTKGLPAPSAQGNCDCSVGFYVTVVLSDQRTAVYGPCILPTDVSAALAQLDKARASQGA